MFQEAMAAEIPTRPVRTIISIEKPSTSSS
jgi:hypothetical protein